MLLLSSIFQTIWNSVFFDVLALSEIEHRKTHLNFYRSNITTEITMQNIHCKNKNVADSE